MTVRRSTRRRLWRAANRLQPIPWIALAIWSATQGSWAAVPPSLACAAYLALFRTQQQNTFRMGWHFALANVARTVIEGGDLADVYRAPVPTLDEASDEIDDWTIPSPQPTAHVREPD